jgi:hypothetical protein
LEVGDLVIFESALPDECSSPYGFNLAEVTQPDAGDCRSEVWLYNNRQQNPRLPLKRTWWKGKNETCIDSEEYTNQDRSASSNAYLDLIHWSRIWEYKVKLKKGMIPIPMVNQLRARVRKFRRQVLKDGPGSSSPIKGNASGPLPRASDEASAPSA